MKTGTSSPTTRKVRAATENASDGRKERDEEKKKRQKAKSQHGGVERERRMQTLLLTGGINLSRLGLMQVDRTASLQGYETLTDCLSSSSGRRSQPYMSETINLRLLVPAANRFHKSKESGGGGGQEGRRLLSERDFNISVM